VRRVKLTVEESWLDLEESGLNGSADGEATAEMEVNRLSEIILRNIPGFAGHARVGRGPGGVVGGIAALYEGHLRCGVLPVL